MKTKTFLFRWSLITFIAIAVIWWLLQLELFESFSQFTWICLTFFSMTNLLLFFVARKAAQSPNKNTFTNILMGVTFVKLIISGVLVVFYNQFADPESKFFLIPFFGLYMWYTAYEVIYLMEIGNQ